MLNRCRLSCAHRRASEKYAASISEPKQIAYVRLYSGSLDPTRKLTNPLIFPVLRKFSSLLMSSDDLLPGKLAAVPQKLRNTSFKGHRDRIVLVPRLGALAVRVFHFVCLIQNDNLAIATEIH